MGLAQEGSEVPHVAVGGIDVAVVGDVVAVVLQRRGIKRQQPDGRGPQVLQIVELLREASEIADAVAVAVVKGAHVQADR